MRDLPDDGCGFLDRIDEFGFRGGEGFDAVGDAGVARRLGRSGKGCNCALAALGFPANLELALGW